MYIIPIKNRLVAIGITIIASLVATAGLFFAINNLSNSLISFNNISTTDTVLQIELFSPLLASIKNSKPVNDFEIINSNLQSSLNLLTSNKLNNISSKDLVGNKGHILIAFTASGEAYLVTDKNNTFSSETLAQPLFSNNRVINDLKIFSNNQDLLNQISQTDKDDNSIMISFNDLARITVLNNIFTATNLATPLNQLKQLLQPLENNGSSYSASIQQSSHRTKIQFFNLNHQTTNDQNPLSPLADLFPQNTTSGFLSINSSSTINSLGNVVNSDLLAKYLTAEQPILYAKNDKNDWMVATISNNPEQIEQLATLFTNLYDLKTVEVSLPDGSYTKEIRIKDIQNLSWKNSNSQNLIWKTKSNIDHDLIVAKNENVYVAGKKSLVNEIINKGGYFPQDCRLGELSTAVAQRFNNKILYFSENTNKNAVFCLFN